MTLGPRRHRQTMAFNSAMAQAQRPVRSTVCAIFRIRLMSGRDGFILQPIALMNDGGTLKGWSLVGESDIKEDIGS